MLTGRVGGSAGLQTCYTRADAVMGRIDDLVQCEVHLDVDFDLNSEIRMCEFQKGSGRDL